MHIILLLLLSCLSGSLIAEPKPLKEQTEKELKQTIKANPAGFRAYYLLAQEYLGLREDASDTENSNINQDLETSGAYYDDALLQLENGENRAAVIQLTNAIKSDTRNLSAYLLLAETLMDMRQYESAEFNYREALKYGADPNIVTLQLGEALIAGEQYEKLLVDLSISNLPSELKPRARVMRGRAYIGMRDYEKAKEELNDATTAGETPVTAHIEMARLGVFENDIDSARDHLDKIRIPGQYLPEYWLILGEINRLEGNDEGALIAYSQALALKEDHLLALQASADLEMETGDFTAAKSLIDVLRNFYPADLRGLLLALNLTSQEGTTEQLNQLAFEAKTVIDTIDYNEMQDDPYTLILVGSIHHLSGRLTEASSALAQYLEFSPTDLYAIRLLANAQLQLKQATAAIRTLNNASKYYPAHPQLALLFAEAFIQQKKYAEAAPQLDLYINSQPKNKHARLQRAKLNASLGDSSSAITELEELYKVDPDTSVLTTLSNLLLATGNYDRVIELVTKTGPQTNETIEADVIRGRAYVGQGLVAKAREAFNSALVKNPTSTSAPYNIALLDLRSGDLKAARQGFKSVLVKDTNHRASLVQLSSMAEQSGNQRDAIQYLKDAIAIAPDVDNHVHLFNLLISNQRDQEARDSLTSLRLEFPENLKVMATEAKWNIINANRERASQIYLVMRDQAQANSSVNNLVSVARFQLELDNNEQAFETLDMAQKLDGSNLSVLIARAEFMKHQEDYEQALVFAIEVIQKSSKQSIGYQLKGDIQLDLGQKEEALLTYKTGLESAIPTTELILRYYTALREQASKQKALIFLENYVRSKKGPNFTILRVIAGAYADVGESARAISLNETLLENRPNDVILLNNLALLYFEAGDTRAKTFAQAAYDTAPDNYAVMDTLGWIMVHEGDISLGVTLLRNALARSANIPEIRYHYAVALHRNGQSKTAAKELRSLLAEGQSFDELEAARTLYEQLQ
ncbi:MAG: putative PEP-CTERM system TPR-repeat lipoprotein [Candidatus Azotimanducaceae bacterium]|jgi:putative PEP-CTERM system TPR-repeat lipoprotein